MKNNDFTNQSDFKWAANSSTNNMFKYNFSASLVNENKAYLLPLVISSNILRIYK